ncbi:hypothetical protein OW763_13500 [Clostridium aestuarii]|uniref:Uncharacterized protein n=1 Tax=Clostridium aestuarii TaxID=338193 RepID=A0ABT4D286_9CLOT|nr:hypothetical protein [Clostridium aestuarii]MCY6485346.1 hypothetical protein [Clostridium aestuarii]
MISKKVKSLIMTAVVTIMASSAIITSVHAKEINKVSLEEKSGVIEYVYESTDGECNDSIDCEVMEYPTYKEIMKDIKIDIRKEESTKLESLYNEAVLLDKENKFEEADKVWNEFDSILDKYIEVSQLCIDCAEQNEEFEASKLIASYEVKGNRIQIKSTEENNNKLSKKDKDKHKLIWERAKQIIPKTYINKIIRYDVITDGKDQILAYVDSPNMDNKTWILSVDIKDAFNENGKLLGKTLNNTLIHEFGHVLTLNDRQIVPQYKEQKGIYVTDEGTTKKNSYLNLFYKKFWKDIYDEYKKVNMRQELEGDEVNLEFYEKYKNRFVSEYASTNPEEDIAESFMRFVVENKPKGKTIAEKKILFFYDFSELVNIRKEIRQNLRYK